MIRRTTALPVTLLLVALAAGCGGDDDTTSDTTTAAPADDPPATDTHDDADADDDADDLAVDDDPLAVVDGAPFPAERCDANRAAGTVTFLTGFDYAAAASIVEVITAESQGYYDELCLDVEILSSFSTANYPLVAGGQGQFASGGSFSEVVAFARANDAELVVVTVAGRTPIDTLIVKPDAADSLDDLVGTTIGVKGKLPASVEVMLLRNGLVEGTDYETVLVDGFDPVAHLAIPSIVGVPGWKSNEPGRLQREGVEFVTFDPSEGGVPGSFGAIFTSREFADEHPTAVEDFVRATLRGLATAIADPDLASAAAVELIEAGGNPNFLSVEGEIFRWRTEAELIATTTPDDVAPGTPDVAGLANEVAAYAEVELFGNDGAGDGGIVPDVDDHVDVRPARNVTNGEGRIVWPG